jgi:predicted peroxiredoxin
MCEDKIDLQVMISAGEHDPERAAMGFATAAAAAVSGSRVLVFLSMSGAVWALANKGTESSVEGFKPIATFFDVLEQSDAQFEGCSSCVEKVLAEQEGDSGREMLRPSVRLAGLAVAAIRATTVPTLTF